MAKTGKREHACRINAAHELVKTKEPLASAASILAKRFRVTSRQAYRYLESALQNSAPLEIPDAKAVLTVRLPVGLITRLRSRPRPPGQSLSDFVASALSAALAKEKHRG